ncbi:MAG TPA: hypothetical protein VFQ32_07540 [Ktedonobacterales bacterium]|nr:hypothetical protein [Ktedonobacterales bacterium]
MRSFALYVELAEYIDLIVPGVAFVGAAIFYMLVEILGYPLASIPTLGNVRWLRFTLMAIFLLTGLVLLIGEITISAPVLFRTKFQLDPLAPFAIPCIAAAPLLVLCLLVVLRAAVDEIRRALLTRQWRRLV